MRLRKGREFIFFVALFAYWGRGFGLIFPERKESFEIF
jgi:hypothetical protein